MISDDDDDDEIITLSGTAVPDRKSTDFDLPDIHSLEDSISEIEYIDDSVDIPVPDMKADVPALNASGFVFCDNYYSSDDNDE